MNRIVLGTLISLFAALSALEGIAVVDKVRVQQESTRITHMINETREKIKPLVTKVQNKSKEAQVKMENLRNELSELSDSSDEEKKKELANKFNEVVQGVEALKSKVQEKTMRIQKDISEEINDKIQEAMETYAKSSNLSLILSVSDTHYASRENDCTTAIIKLIDEGFAQED